MESGKRFNIQISTAGVASVNFGGSSSADTISGGSNLNDGNWHHIAVTVPHNGNSGGVKLYVDGSATSGSGSISINTTATNDLLIGKNRLTNTYFAGQLDDIRLYNAELNSTVVGQIYGSGTGDFNRLQLKAFN